MDVLNRIKQIAVVTPVAGTVVSLVQFTTTHIWQSVVLAFVGGPFFAAGGHHPLQALAGQRVAAVSVGPADRQDLVDLVGDGVPDDFTAALAAPP